MRNFVQIRRSIFVGPKCPSLVIWARNLKNKSQQEIPDFLEFKTLGRFPILLGCSGLFWVVSAGFNLFWLVSARFDSLQVLVSTIFVYSLRCIFVYSFKMYLRLLDITIQGIFLLVLWRKSFLEIFVVFCSDFTKLQNFEFSASDAIPVNVQNILLQVSFETFTQFYLAKTSYKALWYF